MYNLLLFFLIDIIVPFTFLIITVFEEGVKLSFKHGHHHANCFDTLNFRLVQKLSNSAPLVFSHYLYSARSKGIVWKSVKAC